MAEIHVESFNMNMNPIHKWTRHVSFIFCTVDDMIEFTQGLTRPLYKKDNNKKKTKKNDLVFYNDAI